MSRAWSASPTWASSCSSSRSGSSSPPGAYGPLGLRGLGVGLTQVILTTLVAAAACLALAARWQTALFVGFLVALSSTPILLKILPHPPQIDPPHAPLPTR